MSAKSRKCAVKYIYCRRTYPTVRVTSQQLSLQILYNGYMYPFLIQFIVGLITLLFCTQKLVELAKNISRTLRISPLIVGITIVAIGTSLPELAISLVAILKNDVEEAIFTIFY